MAREKHLQVPFSALVGMLEKLEPKDWLLLREWLDEKLAEREDKLMLANPRVMREIHEAMAEYRAEKYVTAKELRSSLHKKSR
jgi:hypothetical protein